MPMHPVRLFGTLALLALGAPTLRAADIEHVSVAADGGFGDADSYSPSLSANGSVVAFASEASDIVAGDANATGDVFVRDRKRGTTTRISVSTTGGDGDGESDTPRISSNGRWVAFTSDATNLVPGDSNGARDIFVADRKTGAIERISVATGGAQANGDSESPSISANGRWVAFASLATNLVEGDTNDTYDVFVHDRKKGTTVRASVRADGTQANSGCFAPYISATGRYLVFRNQATNLTEDGAGGAIRRDLRTGAMTLFTLTDGGQPVSGVPFSLFVSADGRIATFSVSQSVVVQNGPPTQFFAVYVRDYAAGTTVLASAAADGTLPDGGSSVNALTPDGRFLAMRSSATTLVAGDTNGRDDIFLRDLRKSTVARISTGPDGGQLAGAFTGVALTPNGKLAAMTDCGDSAVQGDANGFCDVFVREIR